MAFDFEENEDDYDFEVEDSVAKSEQDIDGICSALRRAWKLLPDNSLAEVFDITLPSSIHELTGEEIQEYLEEFIHQNE